MADHVEALETRVLSVLGQVQLKLAEKDKALTNLIAPPAPTRGLEQESISTEVVKRSRGGQSKPIRRPETADTADPKIVEKPTRSVRPLRTRPPTVLVSRKDEKFPEFLRTLKHNVDPEATGNSIAKMRRTGKGDLMIEINGGADSAKTVRSKVLRSLGPEAYISLTYIGVRGR